MIISNCFRLKVGWMLFCPPPPNKHRRLHQANMTAFTKQTRPPPPTKHGRLHQTRPPPPNKHGRLHQTRPPPPNKHGRVRRIQIIWKHINRVSWGGNKHVIIMTQTPLSRASYTENLCSYVVCKYLLFSRLCAQYITQTLNVAQWNMISNSRYC